MLRERLPREVVYHALAWPWARNRLGYTCTPLAGGGTGGPRLPGRRHWTFSGIPARPHLLPVTSLSTDLNHNILEDTTQILDASFSHPPEGIPAAHRHLHPGRKRANKDLKLTSPRQHRVLRAPEEGTKVKQRMTNIGPHLQRRARKVNQGNRKHWKHVQTRSYKKDKYWVPPRKMRPKKGGT